MYEPAEKSAEIERLRQAVEALEQRLARVEQSLLDLRQDPPPPAQQRLSNWLNETRPDLAPRSVPPPVPGTPIPMASVVSRPPASSPTSSKARRSLETTIGQNWASWIGGVVLFLGVAFFLKYAWDQGWIRPSPGTRVSAAIAVGLMLGALGEWMHRKRLRGLAGSLYGVAVAVVVASFFASHAYFDPPVLSRNVAFTAVALAAAAGIAAALHIDVMTVAILALIGAYLSPSVLGSGRDESAFLLGYFGVLAGAGWLLGYFKPRWIPLRWLVLICTYLGLYGWWMTLGDRNDHHTLALLWTSIFFAGFVVEAVLTLRRRNSEPQQSHLRSTLFNAVIPVSALDANLSLTSLLATAATFWSFLHVLGQSAPRIVGALAVGLALVQIGAGLLTSSRAYLVSSILQSTALVTISVPLLLDEFAITLAWIALAGVLGVLAWQLSIFAARWWAAILLTLSAARLFLFDQSDAALRVVALSLGSQPVSRWLLVGVAIAVLFHLLAWLRPNEARISAPQAWIRKRISAMPLHAVRAPVALDYSSPQVAPRPAMPSWIDSDSALLALLGTGLFAVVMRLQWHGPMFTAAAVAWLVPIVLLSPRGRAIGYEWHAGIVAAVISVRWVVTDNLLPLANIWRNGPGVPAVINLPALCGLLLMACIATLWRLNRQDRAQASELRTVAALAVLVFAWCNFELWRAIDWLDETGVAPLADRANVKQVAISVLWSALGFGGVVFGFRRRTAAVRWVALALLGITLVKILVIDMAEVQAIWRILSFIAVGALLLGVSFVYHRQLQSRMRTEV